MEEIHRRINRIEALISDETVEKLRQLNKSIKTVFNQLPNLSTLQTLEFPNDAKINLVLSNYNHYREVIDDIIKINDIDVNKLSVGKIDRAKLVNRRFELIRLSQIYMENVVNSLIVTEKYVKIVQNQNDFLLRINDEMKDIERKTRQLEMRDEY